MAKKGGGGGGNCDEMTKIWYPVLPGQPRCNVGWDFPAKKQRCVGEGQLPGGGEGGGGGTPI